MVAAESFTEIQRQFTNHLRDPDNAAPPAGADPGRMRIYARAYRAKLVYLLGRRMSPLMEALGRAESFALVDDYVRLPREALGGKSSLDESFADYIKEVSAARGLRPRPCDPAPSSAPARGRRLPSGRRKTRNQRA